MLHRFTFSSLFCLLSKVCLVLCSECVNGLVLTRPRRIVQEGAQVEAVVTGGIRLGMIRWGQSRHLVAVDAVHFEEELDLGRHLRRGARVRPRAGQLFEHGHWAAVLDLAEAPKPIDPPGNKCTRTEIT